MIFNAHQMPPDRPWQSSLQVVKADLGEYSWMIFRCSKFILWISAVLPWNFSYHQNVEYYPGHPSNYVGPHASMATKEYAKNPPTWRTTSTYREGCPPLLPTNHVSRSSNSLRQHLNFIWKHSRLRSLPRWWIPWFPKSDFWSVPLVFFSHESQPPQQKRVPQKTLCQRHIQIIILRDGSLLPRFFMLKEVQQWGIFHPT